MIPFPRCCLSDLVIPMTPLWDGYHSLGLETWSHKTVHVFMCRPQALSVVNSRIYFHYRCVFCCHHVCQPSVCISLTQTLFVSVFVSLSIRTTHDMMAHNCFLSSLHLMLYPLLLCVFLCACQCIGLYWSLTTYDSFSCLCSSHFFSPIGYSSSSSICVLPQCCHSVYSQMAIRCIQSSTTTSTELQNKSQSF